jgi:hypothetical protein
MNFKLNGATTVLDSAVGEAARLRPDTTRGTLSVFGIGGGSARTMRDSCPKVGQFGVATRGADVTLRATGRIHIRVGLRAEGRKMATSGKQGVTTDVTTLGSNTAESVRVRATALDEPASATRIQTVVAQHLRSFDAELGRTRPSL